MRRFKLETVTFRFAGQEQQGQMSFRQIILPALENAGTQGLTIGQVRQSLRIIEAIGATKDGDWLVLSDDDLEYIKARLEDGRFAMAIEPIVRLMDAIDRADTTAEANTPTATRKGKG